MTNNFDNWINPEQVGLHPEGITGGEYIVICPFHGDKHPSATFNPVSGLFYCFSCGATSTAEKLARKLGGSVVMERKPYFRDKDSIEWLPLLGGKLAVDNSYLQERGVSKKQVERHQIHETPNGIAIPIPNIKGRVVGIIIRKYKGTPRYLYLGEKPSLWPMDELFARNHHTDIFVTEGVFGKLRAERFGVPAVSTMGAGVKEEVKNYLSHFKPHIVFDDDFAGYAGAGRIAWLVPLAQVVIPGREADELSKAEWQDIAAGNVMQTRSLSTIAKLSGDGDKFWSRLPKAYKRKAK